MARFVEKGETMDLLVLTSKNVPPPHHHHNPPPVDQLRVEDQYPASQTRVTVEQLFLDGSLFKGCVLCNHQCVPLYVVHVCMLCVLCVCCVCVLYAVVCVCVGGG